MKQQSGVTLLELLIVFVIMSVLFMLALPSLQSFRESSAEKKAARDILSALRLARSQAINENREYQVAFDLDTGRYWLEQEDKALKSSEWPDVRTFDAISPGLKMVTGAGCDNEVGDQTDDADNRIQFNVNGTSGWFGSNRSAYICIMAGDQEKKYRIGVRSSTTGRSSITRWNGKTWE